MFTSGKIKYEVFVHKPDPTNFTQYRDILPGSADPLCIDLKTFYVMPAVNWK